MEKYLLRALLLLPAGLLAVAGCGGTALEGGGAGGAGMSRAGAGGNVGVAGAATAGASAGGAIGGGGATGTGAQTGSGGSVSVDEQACSSNSDCQMVPASCCSCGTGPVSNYKALNSAYVAQYTHFCETADIACAPCPPMPDDLNNPTFYYVPSCQAGRCTVVDLRSTALTACHDKSECALRAGSACCPGCGGRPIALNVTAEPMLEGLVCGSEPQACNDCAAAFPEYVTSCVAGACQVDMRMCTQADPCPL